MTKFVKSKKKDCCGCALCEYVCPVSAIKMVRDSEGCEYPQIDNNKCIHCNKCVNYCIFNNKMEAKNNILFPIYYGARNNSENVVEQSRSGGAFTALSDLILKENGIIYGCILNKDFEAIHYRTDNEIGRDYIRKSKYIQSSIRETYDQIINDLKNNKVVMFSGTPCEVAAIQKAIPLNLQEKLILIDIVCHGVPGNKVWNDYLKIIESKNNGKVEKVEFRNKKVFGWHNSGESFLINNKWINTEDYMTVYNSNLILRDSCYNCSFKGNKSISDITIGDLWGVEKSVPKFNDNKGASLIIVNSNKGLELLNNIKDKMEIIEISEEMAMQEALIKSTQQPIDRKIFWALYKIFPKFTIKLTVVRVKMGYRIVRLLKR